jgi:O-antigen ligase
LPALAPAQGHPVNYYREITITSSVARISQKNEALPRDHGSAAVLSKFTNALSTIIFGGLLVLIVVAVVPYGTVDPWWEAVFESGVLGLTAVWILTFIVSGRLEYRRLAVFFPLAVIALFAFLQTVVWPGWIPGLGRLGSQRTLTIDRYQTLMTARKALALALFLGLLLVQVTTLKRLRWLIHVIIGLGLASAVFGIVRQLTQSPDSTEGFVLPFLFAGTGYGEFIYHNAFAYLMEMTFALIGGLVLGGGVRRDRVLIYLAALVPVWAALVLSESRGGVLSLICQSIFLVFFALTRYSRSGPPGQRWFQASMLVRVLLVVLFAGILIFSVFWMGGEKFATRVQNADTEEQKNRLSRQGVWLSTCELIRQNPWTGTGFGTYFMAITQYQKGAGTLKLEVAHEDYLDLAASGGLVAVVLSGWFVVVIIRRARRALGSQDSYRRAAAFGASAGLLSISVHSLVDFGLQLTGLAVVFGGIIVIAAADVGERQPKPAVNR